MKKRSAIIGLVLVTMMGIGSSHATPFAKTPEEVAFCRARVPAEPHMHHYCDCLRFMVRASRVSPGSNEYRFDVGRAIDGCRYVLARLAPDNYMRPRVHFDHGRALKMAGRPIEAEQEFRKVIGLNPKDVLGYSELVLILKRTRPSEALDIAVLGLRHNPASEYLQKLYLELGGRRPFPDPFDSPQKESEKKAAADSIQEATVPEMVGETAIHSTESDSDGQQTPAEADGRSCRFCPPVEIEERWRESFGANPGAE